ncbi:MAG: hypothetical protein WCH75_29765 [Candidatus Binatia bacterium]|jgi:hypothetical protein
MIDSEEQRLRQRVEERENALREKVNTLKDRAAQIAQLRDVKFLVGHHPGLMLGGSFLVGFLVRKLTGGKNRHDHFNGAYRNDFRYAPPPRSESASGRLWEPIIAIVSAVATRTALGLVGELGRKFIPGQRSRRSEHDSRSYDR